MVSVQDAVDGVWLLEPDSAKAYPEQLHSLSIADYARLCAERCPNLMYGAYTEARFPSGFCVRTLEVRAPLACIVLPTAVETC